MLNYMSTAHVTNPFHQSLSIYVLSLSSQSNGSLKISAIGGRQRYVKDVTAPKIIHFTIRTLGGVIFYAVRVV
jgi:hypothetical protein